MLIGWTSWILHSRSELRPIRRWHGHLGGDPCRHGQRDRVVRPWLRSIGRKQAADSHLQRGHHLGQPQQPVHAYVPFMRHAHGVSHSHAFSAGRTDGRAGVHWLVHHTGLYCSSTTSVTNAFFATTPAGVPAAGTCISGYGPGPIPPSRTCLFSGAWSADTGGCQSTLILPQARPMHLPPRKIRCG